MSKLRTPNLCTLAPCVTRPGPGQCDGLLSARRQLLTFRPPCPGLGAAAAAANKQRGQDH